MGNPVFAPQMLLKDVRGTFIEALMEPRGPSLVEQIATIVQSQSDKENYSWLSEVRAMDEFTDAISAQPLQDTGLEKETGSDGEGYEVKNKTYFGSLTLKRDDLADEAVGGLRQRVRDLAVRALYKKDALVVEKLIAGTSDTCYLKSGTTAEAFFSATHAARGAQSAAWSNLLTGNGTTTANCQTDIGLAIAALYNFTDEANEPLNVYSRQIFIAYPPAMNKAIREAVTAGVISSTSNVQFAAQDIALIQEPRLTSDSVADYYVGILDAEVRGLVWQEREGVTLEELGPGSDDWTKLRQVTYASFLRGRAAFGRPQRLVKVNN